MTSSHFRIGRVILGLGTTSDTDRSIVTAITLAKAIEGEIVGLFVIEEEMVEIAALPFTCTVERSTARRLELTPHIMSQALDREAAACRQALSTRAHRANINWTFNIESGELQARLSAIVMAGDFLIVQRDRYGLDDHHLLNQLRFAPNHVSGLVVTPSHAGKNTGGPVIVLDDGGAAGEKAFLLALRIAQATNEELSLLALASSEAQMKFISNRALNMLPAGQKMSVHRLVPGAIAALKSSFAHLSPSFIVADMQGEPFGNDDDARTLLRTTGAPLILLHSQGP